MPNAPLSPSSTLSSAKPAIGPLLREWRARRRRSQMDLALEAGVSSRHLSFIETGRARPSPATLLALTRCLEVPLRERNELLLAAGYAPRYAATPLAVEDMAAVRDALQRLLAAHDPLPGVVLDRHWNVMLANAGASMLARLLPVPLRTPTINVFRASLHPEGWARCTENFAEWAGSLLHALRRAVQRTADAQLAALLDEVRRYPNVEAMLRDEGEPDVSHAAPLLVPCVLRLPMGRVSLFTTHTAFGTPRDITLDELSVELFYPADDASRAVLAASAVERGASPPGA